MGCLFFMGFAHKTKEWFFLLNNFPRDLASVPFTPGGLEKLRRLLLTHNSYGLCPYELLKSIYGLYLVFIRQPLFC